MKRILLSILIVALIVQLFVPLYMIWERYDILKNGAEVKFDITMYDPYDAFRGRYVSIRARNALAVDEGRYGIVEVRDDGIAVITKVSEEIPKEGLYLTSSDEKRFSFPHDRYYMEEKLAPKAEKLLRLSDNVYITLRIKNGKSVISGLFVDDTPIEEYLTE